MERSIAQFSQLIPLCSPCRQRLAQAFTSQTPWYSAKRFMIATPHDRASIAYSDMSSLAQFSGRESPSLTYRPPKKPHRLHVYATKHNTHITLTRGNREPLISVSAGNLGFKKAARGTYDAAYQLGMFVIARITNQGLLAPEYPGKGGPIKELEVVLRDFGPGREAVTKLLLGAEGAALRMRVSRVMDSTRIKFGGTRSPNPRRL